MEAEDLSANQRADLETDGVHSCWEGDGDDLGRVPIGTDEYQQDFNHGGSHMGETADPLRVLVEMDDV